LPYKDGGDGQAQRRFEAASRRNGLKQYWRHVANGYANEMPVGARLARESVGTFNINVD
jgi:hypothetical protein